MEDGNETTDNIEEAITTWYPRDVICRTNWLYWIDALQNHDTREMQLLWDLEDVLKYYTQPFLVWDYVIKSIIENSTNDLCIDKLQKLFQLIIPPFISYRQRYWFTGEDEFLHYLVFIRTGDTELKLSTRYFGGDPRLFIYSIHLITNHLYDTFPCKISGDFLNMWMPQLHRFRHEIWSKLNSSGNVET